MTSDRVMFENRTSAGRRLGARLAQMALEAPVVLALPRGGVPVGFEIARAIGAPLDVLLVRKIGVPWQPELAAGAVVDGERADIVVNDEVVAEAGLSQHDIERIAARELAEIERRRVAYVADRPAVPVAGRTAIVVDDGVATGATVRAALVALKRRKPKSIVLAIPVAPASTLAALEPLVDDIVCLETPPFFYAIGAYYADFGQLSDEVVVRLLREAAADSRDNTR